MTATIETILPQIAELAAHDRVALCAAVLATVRTEENLWAERLEVAGGVVCVAFGAGTSQARGLAGAVATMAGAAGEFEKLPAVSFFWTFDRHGRRLFRCSYRVPGYKRRTDRLGRDPKKAFRWARYASETLASVNARLLKPEEAHRLLYVDRSPIEQHVEAYDRHLKTKNVSDDYRKNQVFRVRECLKLGDIDRVDQITLAKAGEILQSLRAREAAYEKLTAQTVNYYLRALKTFVRWLKQSGKISFNPIEDAEGVKVSEDEGRRRDASQEELTAIYAAAMRDPSKFGRVMRGPDRAILYLFAYCTGLRRKELRAAAVDWLKLQTQEIAGGERVLKDPYLLLPKKFAKARKRAMQPLPIWLASALVSWLGDRKTGKLFPTMPRATVLAFERDRAAARKHWLEEKGIDDHERERREASDFLKRDTSDGVLVFHSLRHGYGSSLLASGADAKLVQHLMRHSTITLTFDRYGHVGRGRAATAVENALPDMRPAKEKS